MKIILLISIIHIFLSANLFAKELVRSSQLLNRTRHDIANLTKCTTDTTHKSCSKIDIKTIYTNLLTVRAEIEHKMHGNQFTTSSVIILAHNFQDLIMELITNEQFFSSPDYNPAKLLFLNYEINKDDLTALKESINGIKKIVELAKKQKALEEFGINHIIDKVNHSIFSGPRPIYYSLVNSKLNINRFENHSLLHSILVSTYNKAFHFALTVEVVKDEVINRNLLLPIPSSSE